mmetsp:Transcript_29527/g.57930  ORF Transcript_29527/g.57930 Transcript_29527/m.57930 type:complete len:90 (-) Transcript_29527:84-353(-)
MISHPFTFIQNSFLILSKCMYLKRLYITPANFTCLHQKSNGHLLLASVSKKEYSGDDRHEMRRKKRSEEGEHGVEDEERRQKNALIKSE